MQTTMDLLDEVAAKHHAASDYRLAKILGVTKSNISSLRNGKSFPGDNLAIRLAVELHLEPGYVLACIHAERAKEPEIKAAWEGLAVRIAAAVVMGVGVGGLLAGMMPADALPLVEVASSVCVLCKIGDTAQIIDLTPVFLAVALLGYILARRFR